MRSLFFAAPVLLLIWGLGVSDCWANETRDQTSVFLSKYLHHRSLPLVEAIFIPNSNDNDLLLLYGFVATEPGRLNAENQSLDFLCDPDVEIHNLIKVTPALLRPSSSFDAIAAVSTDTSIMDRSGTDDSNAQSGSRGTDDSYDLLEAITDREAERPLDRFDVDE
jgi:hypothetical protein